VGGASSTELHWQYRLLVDRMRLSKALTYSPPAACNKHTTYRYINQPSIRTSEMCVSELKDETDYRGIDTENEMNSTAAVSARGVPTARARAFRFKSISVRRAPQTSLADRCGNSQTLKRASGEKKVARQLRHPAQCIDAIHVQEERSPKAAFEAANGFYGTQLQSAVEGEGVSYWICPRKKR